MQTKTQQLIGHMRAGDWTRALRLAATFRMLGPHRATIVRAHQARVHPSFWRGLGRDPEEAVSAGIAALQQLYPERPSPRPSPRSSPRPSPRSSLPREDQP